MKAVKKILLLLVINIWVTFPQKTGGLECPDYFYCTEPDPAANNLKALPTSLPPSCSTCGYVIRVFIHRVGGGVAPVSRNKIFSIMNRLNSTFNPHGICFSLAGIDYVHHKLLNPGYMFSLCNFSCVPCNVPLRFDCNGDGKFDIYKPNSNNDAIDIYVFPNSKLITFRFGVAASIPGRAIIAGGNMQGVDFVTSNLLSHEMGHCLGLYHTFQGICGGFPCEEYVDGSNCDVCGDFVCDTPADPYVFGANLNATCFLISNCMRIGGSCKSGNVDPMGNPYDPTGTINLIMAYTHPRCMRYFTPGQVDRMRNIISNASSLPNTNGLENTIVPNHSILDSINISYPDIQMRRASDTITTINFVADSGSYVELIAGKAIYLKAGTHIKTGVKAKIRIHPCMKNSNNLRYDVNKKNKNIVKKADNISIYPNPTSRILYIETPYEFKYEIYDLPGNKIKSGVANVGNNELEVSGFAKGMYILKTDKGKAFKFVKGN